MINRKVLGNRNEGFTIIELMVAVGILGILTLVVISLFLQTVNTYGQLMSETDANKQARQCLNLLVREMRESLNFNFQNDAAGGPLDEVQDALLLTSARLASGTFNEDAVTYEPIESSIVLFYINTPADGIPRLMRHQLYYATDLAIYDTTSDFTLLAPDPYAPPSLIIIDVAGTQIPIQLDTGFVNGAPPTTSPRVMMNRVVSFDLIDPDTYPPPPPTILTEVRLTCQYIDRYGRTATSRLRTEVERRN